MGGCFAPFPPTLQKCKGPVSLSFFSAHKIGWQPLPDPGVFLTRRKRVVNIFHVAPTEIRWEAKRDAELNIFKQWADGKDNAPAEPFLSPIRAVLKHLNSHEAGCLRCFVNGGLWPAARLHEAGPRTEPWCTACGARAIMHMKGLGVPRTTGFRSSV